VEHNSFGGVGVDDRAVVELERSDLIPVPVDCGRHMEELCVPSPRTQLFGGIRKSGQDPRTQERICTNVQVRVANDIRGDKGSP
jgi:hypothetical protein